MHQSAAIVLTASKAGPVVVVVSALSGVTNQLLALAQEAASQTGNYQSQLQQITERHLEQAKALLPPLILSGNYGRMRLLLNELEDVVLGLHHLGELSSRSKDRVASFGERLSAMLFADLLTSLDCPANAISAAELIITDAHFTHANPVWEITNRRIQETLAPQNQVVPVVTGFIGSDETSGAITTLGRGGSDYSAAILGAALQAESIEIWTDVNGMLTCDPKRVPKAMPLPEISYEEAMELSHFGAKVIYPPTLVPAVQSGIPIRIANTFDPDGPSTLIHHHAPSGEKAVRGLSSIAQVALLNVSGAGLAGVAGMAARLFTALAQAEVSVILISQASSEHSICVAIAPEQAHAAKQAVMAAFQIELGTGKMDEPVLEGNLSVLAAVGAGMRKHPGTSAKLFRALGNNGINVRAAAQGSSELNISVVVQQQDLNKALVAVHDAFFYEQDRTVNLVLIGPGLIGRTLLEQFAQQEKYLHEQLHLKVNLVGVANSRLQLLNPAGISIHHWQAALAETGQPADLPSFVAALEQANLPNLVVADCTAGTMVNPHYGQLLSKAISVVTPNKTANSGSLEQYQTLKTLAARHHAYFLYETNVGAGLPIINTLQGLVQSGDPVLSVQAVLSGTLSYIFNTFGPEVPFYEAVKQAQDAGYTEPDPRDDLSGLDMARKVLILAREIGLPMEASDISISPLLPEAVANANSVAEFYEALKSHDDYFSSLASEAAASGKRLRYLANIQDGKAGISLVSVGADDPFYSLSGSENMVVFRTLRYNTTPLVVKGPGAGADVTAAGVFADIIRCGLR